MSKFVVKVEHLPKVTGIEMSRPDLELMLEPLGLEKAYLWDSRYYYASHEDWGKVFGKVLLNMPKYIYDIFDCENIAFLVSVRVAELFHLNTCGICIGKSPAGYHGFNVFVSEEGLSWLEPQTGEVFPVQEKSGYIAELVIFG